MAILPESMNKLDSQNMPGSLAAIENYIRYTGERIEFSLSGLSKEIGSVKADEGNLLKEIDALKARVAALEKPATAAAAETEE